MKVKVRPLNNQGRPLPMAQANTTPASEGLLLVTEERDRRLGRSVMRARLLHPSDGAQTDLLPLLSDAQLIHIENGRLRLAGIEERDGVSYAQTWAVEVL